MKQIFLWWLHILGSVVGIVFAIISLVLDLMDKGMRGLPWQVWALIGFVIFAASLITLLIRLSNELNRITNAEAKLRRRQLELDVEAKEVEKQTRDSVGQGRVF
jgi:predicted membrane channel-forming protein YqfA (hemolysin III family)